jgi:hypothetical protein
LCGRARIFFLVDQARVSTGKLNGRVSSPKAFDECTIRPATSPALLRHAARRRAIPGPALQRRRAVPHPPIRPAHLCGFGTAHGRKRHTIAPSETSALSGTTGRGSRRSCLAPRKPCGGDASSIDGNCVRGPSSAGEAPALMTFAGFRSSDQPLPVSGWHATCQHLSQTSETFSIRFSLGGRGVFGGSGEQSCQPRSD